MATIWHRFWGCGELDIQDEVTGLSKRDVYNITNSWAVLYSDPNKYGMQIFLRLFQTYPETQKLFVTIEGLDNESIVKNIQFQAHVLGLMSAIQLTVTNLHRPEVLIVFFHKLGKRHHWKRVEKGNFDELRAVLVDYLQNVIKLNDNTILAWARLIDFIFKHVLYTLCDKVQFTPS